MERERRAASDTGGVPTPRRDSIAPLLFRLVTRRPVPYAMGLLCAIAGHLLWAAPGLLVRRFFHLLWEGEGTPESMAHDARAILVLLGLTAAGYVATNLGGWSADAAANFAGRLELRRNLVSFLLLRPDALTASGTPGGNSTGAILDQLRDDVDDALSFSGGAATLCGQLAYAALAVTVMGRISIPLTLLVIAPLVGVALVARSVRGRIAERRKASRVAAAAVTGFLGETFRAIPALQAAGAEGRLIARLDRLNRERRKAALRDALLNQSLGAVFNGTVSVGAALILLLAIRSLRDGALSLADYSVFHYFLGGLGAVIGSVGQFAGGYRQAGVAIDRLRALLAGSQNPDADLITGPAPAPRPVHEAGTHSGTAPAGRSGAPRTLLEIESLAFAYPRGGWDLRTEGLRLRHGEFTVVTGRVGSGKSTLLRASLGMLSCDRALYRWDGETVVDPASFFEPPRVAYVAQAPRLFRGTVRDNILLGREDSSADVWGAVRTACLEEDIAAMPEGLDTVIGSGGLRLSGGQVQRLAIARAAVRAPQLIVVDDLSRALDGETERIVWERLLSRPGSTVLAVSHRPAVLARADRILVMAGGRIVGEGRLGDLLSRSGELREIWRHGGVSDGAPN